MSYANLSQKHVSQKVYFMKKINKKFQTIFVLGRVVRNKFTKCQRYVLLIILLRTYTADSKKLYAWEAFKIFLLN